ncbi:hypothetical protein Tco_1383290 [Tanacetum coccineum]
MDSIIPLGQKNTLAEYMILSGADNRPPMLDKDLYDSWKSIMELYMQNREHERMIFESVEHCPLIWPTIEENRVTRTKKYTELSATEKIQADCDMKATNIILQGLPTDIYLLVNHHRVAKDLWERVQLLILPPEWSKFVTDVKLVKDLHTTNYDQLHAYLEQHELHANEVRIMRERNQDPLALTEDLDAYDSDCDDVSNAKAVLMANLSSYGSDVLSKVPHSDSHHNDMDNQSVHAMQDFEQTPILLKEKANQEKINESVTAELERYKERVKTFKQHLNVDLSTHEKMIDSQMDDMIKEKLALKQQIDSLEQNLSNQIKEKQSLLQTFTIFKNESKEKENKYIDNEFDLEKKIKEQDNIVYKVGQSAQTVHMLTKPQVFYDNAHKQALDKHVLKSVFIDEETLILEELNRLSEDFSKRFVPQQELSDEQAFWLQTSHPNTDQFASSPVKIEAPRELPKEQANILWGIFEQAKAKQPIDNALDLACCPDCSLVSGLRMFKTSEWEQLLAHELR